MNRFLSLVNRFSGPVMIVMGFYIGSQNNPYALAPALLFISVGLFAVTANWAEGRA